MANYEIEFEGEITGSPPSNFTDRWVTTGHTWAIREKAGTFRGKCLEHTRTTSERRLLSWDTPGSVLDADILCRVRSNSWSSANQVYLVARGSGAAGTETGYYLRNVSNTQIALGKYVAGVSTNIGATVTFDPVALTTNQWLWMRFRVQGTSLKAKVWKSGQAEPAAWNIEATDASIAAAGWVGVGGLPTTGTRDWDALAVGTTGDTATFTTAGNQRVTQSALLVLDTGNPQPRTTQSSLLVLGEDVVTVPMRITQSVNLVLTEFITDLNVTQSAVLVLADHVPCLTKWAQCWIITRTDGVVYGFTTLDVPVLCRGVMCYPCDSLMATAAEHSTMLGTAGDMEATGIISDSGISAEDIQAGLFDRAAIEVWNQPWDNVNDEIPFRIAAGTLGSVTFGLNQYTFQVRTDAAKLKQTALLETYTPGCRYQFGNQRDSRCPVDLTTITVSGAVDATVVANSSTMSTRRAFIDSARAEAPGFFNFGRLTWLTGDNAGYSSEVKSSDGSTIVLWDTMPNIIQIGDTYDIHPGCDKTKSGHLLYNADMVDFGGFPDVPGQDSINQTPDQKG